MSGTSGKASSEVQVPDELKKLMDAKDFTSAAVWLKDHPDAVTKDLLIKLKTQPDFEPLLEKCKELKDKCIDELIEDMRELRRLEQEIKAASRKR
ncbi:hypothetical protein G7046_g3676 [Stylonectria norvegica]|nr:hypothetical protein G7046_g3676 [Stylonectria norvegica]